MVRKARPSGVRGPNSALTEFLRVEGITDAFRQRQNRQRDENNSGTEEVTSSPAESPRRLSSTPRRSRSGTPQNSRRNAPLDEEERQIREAGRQKRRASKRIRNGDARGDPDSGSDSSSSDDYASENDDDYDLDDDVEDNLKKYGEEDMCAECGNPFTLSVYSRYVDDLKGYLCDDCNEELKKREKNARRNELNARKKRKKLAAALLDKKTVRIPKLQDICIKVITQNINDVEALGDIGQSNMNKILRILSKNRSLDDSTISLFLNPDLRELEFWDCSNVSSHSFNQIAAYCAQLQSLTLSMCGQLHNDNLVYFKDKLNSLTKLSLDGPFLISNPMWQDFFEQAETEITQFEIRNTHRFGSDAFLSLMEKRGPHLTLLKLLRLDGLDSTAIYELIPHYITAAKLTELEISYPHKPEIITDELMIHILAITGESLTYLNVDGCSNLTDEFFKEGVAKFCPRLEHLSMRGLDLLTTEEFVEGFKEFAIINSGGLVTVDLTKCRGLGDDAIYKLLGHSSQTLVDLSLNSLDLLSKDFLVQIMTKDESKTKRLLKQAIEDGVNDNVESEGEKQHYYRYIHLPLLTRLDVGFVRSFDDEVASKFSECCPKLTILEVFGDNKCTVKAKVRTDLLVIGRQGDLA